MQGFLQIYGIDFNEISFLTIRKKFLQIFLIISIMLNLVIDQIDMVRACLKSLLINNNLLIFIKLLSDIETFKSIKTDLVVRLL